MEEAEQAARGVDSLHGVIRLAMPVLYGTRAVIPALATFLARHPDLRVEMIMSDARQNLITDGVDVAIRLGVGPLDDSTFGSRKLALVERLVVAAPSYLSAHGAPANPAELARHDCIVQHGLFGRESWRFTHNQTVTSVNVPAKLWINSAPGILAAAVAGMGIALATRVMAGEELRTGLLTQLLEPYRLDPAEVYAVSRQVRGHQQKFGQSWITLERRSTLRLIRTERWCAKSFPKGIWHGKIDHHGRAQH